MATEQLSEDNQYHCEACAGKSDAIRQTTLTSLPHTFIFTLNRFSYDRELKCRSKLLTKVSVPGWVGFSASSDGSHALLKEGELQYRLYATVVHSGSTTESGHYYTYGLPSTHATDVLSRWAPSQSYYLLTRLHRKVILYLLIKFHRKVYTFIFNNITLPPARCVLTTPQ